MKPSIPLVDHALLNDFDWLRALARSLVVDDHRAEDAAQETWIAALRREAYEGRAGRGWLAVVLRNRLRQGWRAESRRAVHESSSVSEHEAPSTADVTQRIELQQRLLEQVQQLDDPYRTAIVMRFMDGLQPREIAKQLGRPVKTINTHIARGLQRLRVQLDQESGGNRGVWLSAFAPFLDSPSGTSQVAALSLIMNVKLLLPVLLLVGGGALYSWWDQRGPLTPEALDLPLVEASLPGVRKATAPASQPTQNNASARAVLASDLPTEVEAAAIEEPATLAPAVQLEGRVVDVHGDSVPDLIVGYQTDPETDAGTFHVAAQADKNGHFQFPLPDEAVRLDVRDERYAALTHPYLAASVLPKEIPLVIVAQKRHYSGVVLDQNGVPIPETTMSVLVDVETATTLGFATPLAHTLKQTQTDEQGRFDFEGIPWAEGVLLQAVKAGYEVQQWPLKDHDDLRMQLALEPRTNPGTRLYGLVIGPDQQPAAQAMISAGGRTVRSDKHGTFLLDLGDDDSAGMLYAIQQGLTPARYAITGEEQTSQEKPLVLELGPALPSLRGRVLDDNGDPLSNVIVLTTSKTPFGMVPYKVGSVEFTIRTSVEDVLGTPDGVFPSGRSAISDANGDFEIENLLDREYGLHALHSKSMRFAIGSGRPGGPPVKLRFESSALQTVKGSVRSLGGRPLAGQTVLAYRKAPTDGDEPMDAKSELEVKTDEEGRFDLGQLDVRGLGLRIWGPDLAWTHDLQVEDHPRSDQLDLSLSAEVRLRVFCDYPLAGGENIHAENAKGEMQRFTVEMGSIALLLDDTSISDEGSQLILCNESVLWIVMTAESGEEIDRVRVPKLATGVAELHF